MFAKKVKTVGTINEFMTGSYKTQATKKAVAHQFKVGATTLATGLTAITMTNNIVSKAYAQSVEAIPVMAAMPTGIVGDTIKETAIQAFMPLVDILVALSDPVALVIMTGGALMYMLNFKERGILMVQNACIGYVLIHLMPVLMGILTGITAPLAT